MLISRKIRLTSPILASRPTQQSSGRRTFDRVTSYEGPGVRIKTYIERWNWAFLEARDALDFGDVSVATILPLSYFDVKNTSTYNRTQSTSKQKESFECIPSGSVIEWFFTLSSHIPPHAEDHPRYNRPPTEAEFDDMLSHIGRTLGMSFWGHGYLFGLFEIQQYKP